MPTYNYYCNTCDTHFSYFQKMSELPFSKCENCGKKINRLITGGTGLIFKGSGFYLTDYKNESKSQSSENVKQGESKEGKDETKQFEDGCDSIQAQCVTTASECPRELSRLFGHPVSSGRDHSILIID